MSSVLRGHARAWLCTLWLGCASQAHAVDAVTPVAYSVVTAGSPVGTAPTTLTLMLPLPTTLSDQPALADGTLVRSANLPIWPDLAAGQDPSTVAATGWIVGADVALPLWYSIAEEAYASAYSYLLPSGASGLHISMLVRLPCHGGCTNTSTLDLELTRDDDMLYTSELDLSTLVSRASVSGSTVHEEVYYVSGTTLTDRWDFVGAPPVPEPATFVLALSGVAAAGLARRRRKPLAQPAQSVQ
jgi:hypothetical protein